MKFNSNPKKLSSSFSKGNLGYILYHIITLNAYITLLATASSWAYLVMFEIGLENNAFTSHASLQCQPGANRANIRLTENIHAIGK